MQVSTPIAAREEPAVQECKSRQRAAAGRREEENNQQRTRRKTPGVVEHKLAQQAATREEPAFENTSQDNVRRLGEERKKMINNGLGAKHWGW
jgi:hypothetical protein